MIVLRGSLAPGDLVEAAGTGGGLDVGFVRESHLSGWLWACALCPAANPPGGGTHAADTAVRHLVEHIEHAHGASNA